VKIDFDTASHMKVAYVFATAGQTIDYVLGDMILPQLEAGTHGVDVVGMFFFHDNTFALREGDPLGERLAGVADEQEIMLMLCDQCATRRGLAEFDRTGEDGRDRYEATNTVEGVTVGCFPDLYGALGEVGVDQVITL
jgi:sulfur relay (sulfurtransferase) complex TusBCD TusD component (DsrE family)